MTTKENVTFYHCNCGNRELLGVLGINYILLLLKNKTFLTTEESTVC